MQAECRAQSYVSKDHCNSAPETPHLSKGIVSRVRLACVDRRRTGLWISILCLPFCRQGCDDCSRLTLFAPRFFPIRPLHGDPRCRQIPQFLPVVTKARCQKLPATMSSKRRSGPAGLPEDFTATPDPKRRKRNDVSPSIPLSTISFFLPSTNLTPPTVHATRANRFPDTTPTAPVSIPPAPAVCNM